MIKKLKSQLAKLRRILMLSIDEQDKWNAPASPTPEKIDYTSAIPFILLHLSVLFVFAVGYSPIALILAIVFYFLRMFAITGFYHRYFSHKSFKTNRFWQACFALLGVSAIQKGPIWWAAHHRDHHIYSDKPGDMHSPVLGGFWDSHVLWILRHKSFSFNKERVKDLLSYPELYFISRFHRVLVVMFLGMIYLSGALLNHFFPGLHTSGAQLLVWVGVISTITVYHATYSINSLTHMYGRRRYKTTDNSKNSFFIALFTMGEGWHNNHHYYPNSTRQGFYWWEIDLTYYTLKLLEKSGIIWDLQPPSKRAYDPNNTDLIKNQKKHSDNVSKDAEVVVTQVVE